MHEESPAQHTFAMGADLLSNSLVGLIININNDLYACQAQFPKTELRQKSRGKSCGPATNRAGSYPTAKVRKTIDIVDLIQPTASQKLAIIHINNSEGIFAALQPGFFLKRQPGRRVRPGVLRMTPVYPPRNLVNRITYSNKKGLCVVRSKRLKADNAIRKFGLHSLSSDCRIEAISH